MRIECLSNFSSVISLRADAFAINLVFSGVCGHFTDKEL